MVEIAAVRKKRMCGEVLTVEKSKGKKQNSRREQKWSEEKWYTCQERSKRVCQNNW